MSFEQPTILVLFGRGGSDEIMEPVFQAAKAFPGYRWLVVGKDEPQCNLELPNNLDFAGWVADATSYIEAAELVVTAAGHNSVMEVGRARKRFIAIAEPRPFDEQLRKVHVLNREQLSVGLSCWPSGNKSMQLVSAHRQVSSAVADVTK